MALPQRIVTTVAPTAWPVTVDEARAQCSLTESDGAAHDDLLLRLIKSTTLQAEAYIGGRIMQQTVRIELDGFPAGMGVLELTVYPVQSISELAYYDSANANQTLTGSGTDYWADLAGPYPRLCPVDGWPDTYPDRPAVVRVTAVVGYATPSAVPQDVKDAILVRVAERFRNREEVVMGPTSRGVAPFEALLDPHRRLVV